MVVLEQYIARGPSGIYEYRWAEAVDLRGYKVSGTPWKSLGPSIPGSMRAFILSWIFDIDIARTGSSDSTTDWHKTLFSRF